MLMMIPLLSGIDGCVRPRATEAPRRCEAMAFDAVNAAGARRGAAGARTRHEGGLVFRPEPPAEDNQHLLEMVEKKAAETRDQLPRLAAKAATEATGRDDMLVGQIYLSEAQYQQAVDALTQGLHKGGLQDADEAQVSLGIAYLKLGRKELAGQAFRAVDKGSRMGRFGPTLEPAHSMTGR